MLTPQYTNDTSPAATAAPHQNADSVPDFLDDVINDALAGDHFRMVYQPQFSMTSGKLMGFEALIRCQSPKFGVISPAEFIPHAEENGSIVEIGNWTFQQALSDLAQMRNKGMDCYMSVNLSPAQFGEGDVFERIMLMLVELGLPASVLKLELTETALIRNAKMAMRTFQAFQREGAQIWLDDFGTGFASLNLLREFNIDGLKIDRSFVDGLHRSDEDFTLCSAIIAMAQRLGLFIVAEGIENEEQMAILGQLGCDSAQGFLLGRPVSLDETLHTFASTKAIASTGSY
jgi:EAL domain-containing protein (putative c-di-GMP-specific phosphodiesterase class I)